ncbi:MAG: lysine--tRNA ligase [Candidatus Aenigmarchaeota archaeon]|nr:lysine--tRNA ligase [Candidatus Aenigmarchaeota archaeon]
MREVKKKHDGALKDEIKFWADQLAEEAVKKAGAGTVTCKCAASPSGAKHIGNLFDIMKSYNVYKSVLKKGHPARFIFTSDDRDPLRTIPPRLPTLDAKWVPTERFEKRLSEYLGHPYTDIPDPFECCQSWAEHFTKVWLDGIYTLIPEKEIHAFSNTELYEKGDFDPYIEIIFKNIKKARKIISKFQKSVTFDYIPFHAICERCGKITTKVVGFDIDKKAVSYICSGRELAGKYKIEGCGHRGETSWHNGKLAWRFETPAQMALFHVTVEPFGKEHAEGTVRSSKVILKDLFEIDPPLFPIYEFLLVGGKKMSAREGNVYLTQEILDIIEPEVFAYFYTKRSLKQRDLDLKNIYHLVDEFDKAERIFFGAEKLDNEKEKMNIIRMYETAIQEIPKELPVRIPYKFAAVVAQTTAHLEHAIKVLTATSHVKRKLSGEDMDVIRQRLNLAKNWVVKFSPENMIKINEKIPESIAKKLTDVQKQALRDLVIFINDKPTMDEEELTNKFYEIINYHNMKSADFFSAAYQVLIDKKSGPKLAQFIIAIGELKVKKLLEQI